MSSGSNPMYDACCGQGAKTSSDTGSSSCCTDATKDASDSDGLGRCTEALQSSELGIHDNTVIITCDGILEAIDVYQWLESLIANNTVSEHGGDDS